MFRTLKVSSSRLDPTIQELTRLGRSSARSLPTAAPTVPAGRSPAWVDRSSSWWIGAGFTRATALRALSDLDSRIERVAAERPHRIGVDEVIVFGSILDREQGRVGDVDGAVGLDLVGSNATLDDVFNIYKRLKGRSRTISIVELEPSREIVENGTHLVIWRGGVRAANVSDLR